MPDKMELTSYDINSFVTLFAHKENATIPVLPNTKYATFGLNLCDEKITSWTYVKDIDDTVSSSAAKLLKNQGRNSTVFSYQKNSNCYLNSS